MYDFDAKTGILNYKNASENVVNPSYLTLSEDNKFVYSVNENGNQSSVSSFGFNQTTGKLNFSGSSVF